MEWNFDFEKFREDFENKKVRVSFLNVIDAIGFAKNINVNCNTYIEPTHLHNSLHVISAGGKYEPNSMIYGLDLLEKIYPIKQKTLLEQALALIGLEVEQEFEFKFPNSFGISNIFKFSESGTLWNKTSTGWQTTIYGLHTILVSGKLPKIHKPKSEAELILDELEKAVDKANDVLRRSGR